MTKIAEPRKRLTNNPEFRKEYEKADAEFAIIEALVKARTTAKLSHAELRTTQSAVAGLEGCGIFPTLSTLRRYTEATGTKLHVELVTP